MLHQDVSEILIVDSDEIFAQTLCLVFQKKGFKTRVECTGERAVAAAREQVFDVIVCEVTLPGGLDGIETIEKIKLIRAEQPLMMIVAAESANVQAPIRAIRAGVDEYMVKPVPMEYLLQTLQRHMRMRALEAQERNHLRTIEERTRRLAFFFEIGRELTASLDLDVILQLIVERTVNVLEAERCSILLTCDSGQELYISAAYGLPSDVIKNSRIRRGEMICGWIFDKGTSILVDDLETDSRFQKPNEAQYVTHSFIGVPLIYKNKTIGVINVSNNQRRDAFSQDDLILLEGIADQAAIAIANARFYRHVQHISLQVIASLMSTIEVKDHYTRGHSERVTKYAVAIAEAMGLSYEQIAVLRRASELHDLGKIGIHDNVLTKQGKLAAAEWEEMKQHPMKGADILRPLEFLSREIVLIEQHHERYDGSGYPFGFKDEQISLGARIMAVADAFDAMTTNRPYSSARTRQDAMAELQRCRGTQFDPAISDVFIALLENPVWCAAHIEQLSGACPLPTA